MFIYELYSIMRLGIDYISEQKGIQEKKPITAILDLFTFNTLIFFAMGIFQLLVFAVFTTYPDNLVYLKTYSITPILISFNFLFWMVNVIMMITAFTTKNLENNN